MDDNFAATLKLYQRRRAWANAMGTLAVIGWIWAAWLAFYPVTADGASPYNHCGAPALFDGADNSYYTAACDSLTSRRIGGAVGVSVLVLPFSAAWIRNSVLARVQRDAVPSLEWMGQ
ncbi:hypothetical protein [Kitasatospora sp. NPDC093558]|uniref:hypothetical protein n=1 Tax=Kitasatospora sp. NPDC093558 TaxID=3155201 RepID=UPI00344AA62A